MHTINGVNVHTQKALPKDGDGSSGGGGGGGNFNGGVGRGNFNGGGRGGNRGGRQNSFGSKRNLEFVFYWKSS